MIPTGRNVQSKVFTSGIIQETLLHNSVILEKEDRSTTSQYQEGFITWWFDMTIGLKDPMMPGYMSPQEVLTTCAHASDATHMWF